jgi:fluoride exporter
MLIKDLYVLMGGALGAWCRFRVGLQLQSYPVFNSYWATAAVNIIGTFILGVIWSSYHKHSWQWLLFGVGFCGGLTTFSTLMLELNTTKGDRLGLGVMLGSLVIGYFAFNIGKTVPLLFK